MSQLIDEDFEEYLASDFPINTGDIFTSEQRFWRDTESSNWTKYPHSLADDLIDIITHLIVDNVKPSYSHSEERKEYLKNKADKRIQEELRSQNPFVPDYIVLGLGKPIEMYDKPDVHYGGEFHYLYELATRLRVTKKTIRKDRFELLFAFALRQCNIAELDSFFKYHLDQNFDGDMKEFRAYVAMVKRKYENPLYHKGLAEAIQEWIILNESNPNPKKIKTSMTVGQLAFLFRMLVKNKLISEEPLKRLFECICLNFESKGMEQISALSFHNNYHSYTKEAAEFWIDQFDKLEKLSIRELQKKDE